MVVLNKYELNFENAVSHLKWSLEDTNALSSSLMKLTDFNSGCFFTLLPNNIDQADINKFRNGGIANGARNQVWSIILKKLNSNKKLTCVFDYFNGTYSSDYDGPIYLSHGMFYNDEIYYILTQKTANLQIIQRCFTVSNAIWHSLCVLSEIDLNYMSDKKLTLDTIKDICIKAELIIVGAYDGEGCIFWQKDKNGYSSKSSR